MTADAADVVTTYNANDKSGCGMGGGWALGVARSVEGRFCAPWTFPAIGTSLYERAWVSGDELRVGSFPAVWNNTSPDKRPTTPGLMVFHRQNRGERNDPVALFRGRAQLCADPWRRRAVLDKAEAHCAETGIDPDELLKARLADDMLPFGYQVKSCAAHSIGAIDGVRAGVFSPDMSPWPTTFEGLRAAITAHSPRSRRCRPTRSTASSVRTWVRDGRDDHAVHRGGIPAVILAAEFLSSTRRRRTTSCAGRA